MSTIFYPPKSNYLSDMELKGLPPIPDLMHFLGVSDDAALIQIVRDAAAACPFGVTTSDVTRYLRDNHARALTLIGAAKGIIALMPKHAPGNVIRPYSGMPDAAWRKKQTALVCLRLRRAVEDGEITDTATHKRVFTSALLSIGATPSAAQWTNLREASGAIPLVKQEATARADARAERAAAKAQQSADNMARMEEAWARAREARAEQERLKAEAKSEAKAERARLKAEAAARKKRNDTVARYRASKKADASTSPTSLIRPTADYTPAQHLRAAALLLVENPTLAERLLQIATKLEQDNDD